MYDVNAIKIEELVKSFNSYQQGEIIIGLVVFDYYCIASRSILGDPTTSFSCFFLSTTFLIEGVFESKNLINESGPHWPFLNPMVAILEDLIEGRIKLKTYLVKIHCRVQ